jgi:hypothetical protein
LAAPKKAVGPKSDKLWREAIMLAVHEEDEATGKKKLRALAEELVKKAETGDVTALKEIGDRLDGKPPQQIQHADNEGGKLKYVPVATGITRG